LRCAHYTLAELGSHTRVQFDCYAFLCLFKNADCKVTRAGTDFEDHIGLGEIGFCDDGVCYTGILEDMLAVVVKSVLRRIIMTRLTKVPKVCVHLENAIAHFCFGSLATIWATIAGIFLL